MKKEYSTEELQEIFFERLEELRNEWLSYKDLTEEQKLNGIIYSILSILDGPNSGTPGFDVITRSKTRASLHGTSLLADIWIRRTPR